MSQLIISVFVLLLLIGFNVCRHPLQEDNNQTATRSEAESSWSIGIYTGPSPFHLLAPGSVSNPVLTASDVTDFEADILAHPFMIVTDSLYYMFFTVKYGATDEGGIGLAQSKNGFDWEYQQLVIKEPFVLSYPYVFRWKNDYYLIPEAHTETSVRLYRATDFPTKWEYQGDLVSGDHFISASVVYYDSRWWMFVSPKGNDTLRLFFASDLTGSWTEHPLSPVIVKDPNIARPGGRLLIFDDTLYRMGQDCDPSYGNQVHAFKITEISPTSYEETIVEPPLVKATSEGWNAEAMHHVDLHQVGENEWIAAVDALGIIPF